MPQSSRVPNRTSFFAAQVSQCALGEVSVAGMHGDDAVRHTFQQIKWIFPRNVGIAGIVVDAEVGMIDAVYEFTEHIRFLCEFRVRPEVVLIMVLKNKGNSTFF